MPDLTLANVITDASRAAALAWGVNQQGGQTDGLLNDGSIRVGRAATNLHPHAQCDTNGNYQAQGVGVVIGAPDAGVPAPFSPKSIPVTTDGGSFNQGVQARSLAGQAAAAGVSGVGSIRFKGTAGQQYIHRVTWLNADASVTNGANTQFVATGEWQELRPAAAAVGAGKTGDILIVAVFTVGQRAETFHVAHPMIEKGQSVVAPYVPASGGVTATQPAGRVQADASLLDETQGAIVMRVRMGWSTAAEPGGGTGTPSFFGWQDNVNNGLLGFYRESNNTIEMQRKASVGGQSSAITAAPAFAASDELTLVFAWDATHTYVSVNGGAFVSAGGGGIPALAAVSFDIGTNGQSNFALDGDVLYAATFNGDVTTLDPAAIDAAFGAGDDPDYAALGFQPTAVMPMETSFYYVPPVNTSAPVVA